MGDQPVAKSVENLRNGKQTALPADTSARNPLGKHPLESLIHRKSVNRAYSRGLSTALSTGNEKSQIEQTTIKTHIDPPKAEITLKGMELERDRCPESRN
jgi:hypothetical protein